MEILAIVIPAALVLLTAYLLLDKMLKNEDKRRSFELRKTNLSTVTPIRLRAYERLALVLERTEPNSIMIGIIRPEMTCMDLHAKLLDTIRQEFAHNTSQQIYVSENLWISIITAKESLIQLVNTCAASVGPSAPAQALAERIIQVYAATESTPSEIALQSLKDEVKMYF